MPRIQITIPEKKVSEIEIPVRVSDLNYGGHVGHDSILTLMQEARVTFYRSLGITDELTLEGRIGQIISDAAIQYKSESFLGDILLIEVFITEFHKYGFQMLYLIKNKRTGKEVARGQTGIICFDYERKKIAGIPESFLQKLKDFNQDQI